MLIINGNGRITRAPELRATKDGKSVCNLSVASDQRNRDDGPQYVEIVLWEGAAEAAAEHLVKGQAITFSGRFKLRTYETRDGEQRSAIEVHHADTEWGHKPRGNGNDEPAPSPAQGVDEDGNEIPF